MEFWRLGISHFHSLINIEEDYISIYGFIPLRTVELWK